MPNHRTTLTLVCAQCGASFERGVWHPSQAPKHCSQACVSDARRDSPLPLRSERATVPCARCGNPVTRTVAYLTANASRGRQTYCSRGCSASATHTGLPKPKSRANLARTRATAVYPPPWNKKPAVVKSCENCGTELTMPPCRAARTRFCSKECKHAKRRTVTGAAHWLFTSVECICEMCGRVVPVKASLVTRFRFCSRRCTGSWVSTTWPRTSSIERVLHDELTARTVPFLVEHAIGPYTVDIAFPAARLVVEADGTYWHGSDRQKAKDRQKDEYMRTHGWTVVRFTEVAIRADPSACIESIIPLLTPIPTVPTDP